MKRSRARWLGAALAAGAIAGGAVAAQAGAAPIVGPGGTPPVVAGVTQITLPTPDVWAIPPPFTPGTTTAPSAPYTVSIMNTDATGYTVNASSTDGAAGPPPALLKPELHLVSSPAGSTLKAPFGAIISVPGSFATPAALPGVNAVGGRTAGSAPVAADQWTFEGRVVIDPLFAGTMNVGMNITAVPGF